MFNYKSALVCRGVPRTLLDGLSLKEHEPVDLKRAEAQHHNYLECLKKCGVQLVEISPDDQFADCVFVEDTAVVVGNRVLLTNLGAVSRRGEVEIVKRKFQEIAKELNLEITEVEDKNEAFIDGGDVCFTGRELLVGISSRTNHKGAEALQAAFKDIPVTSCEVRKGLHLKSSLTMLSEDTILIGKSEAAQFLKQQIQLNSTFAQLYKFVEVAEDENGSANVLYFNGFLVYPAGFEHIYQELDEFKAIQNKVGLENGEFKKIDGCLTCRSIFFNQGV